MIILYCTKLPLCADVPMNPNSFIHYFQIHTMLFESDFKQECVKEGIPIKTLLCDRIFVSVRLTRCLGRQVLEAEMNSFSKNNASINLTINFHNILSGQVLIAILYGDSSSFLHGSFPP